MKQAFKFGLIAGVMALTACSAAPSGTISVTDAWARETTTGVKVSAAYARIENGTEAAARLVGAETPAAGRVEIHSVVNDGGIMRMRPLDDGLEIPSGQGVDLRPGGYHLMLLDLRQPLRSGEQVSMTLQLEGREPVRIDFTIRSARDAARGGSHE